MEGRGGSVHYIAHRTGVCEGEKRKYCVTHSWSMFGVCTVASSLGILTWIPW